jgi:hypothetical protein
VRLEIETALRKEKPLIPVLVSRAVMPRTDVLPASLHDFAYRNAVQVDSGQDFDVHVGRLIRAIERIVRIDQERMADEAAQDAPPIEPTPKAKPPVDPVAPPAGPPIVRAKGGHTVRWGIGLGLVVILGIIAAGGWWVLVEQPPEMVRREAAGADKEEPARQTILNEIKGRLDFCSGGVTSEEYKAKLQDVLSNFIFWAQTIGARQLDRNIIICIYTKDSPIPIVKETLAQGTITSFYSGDTLYIDKSFSTDMSVLVHVYSHHVLINAVKKADLAGIAQAEIEAGLADYLSASFLESPIIGALGGRTLDNDLIYLSSTDIWTHGLVWGGALWTCRKEARGLMDQLIFPAWEAAGNGPNPQKEFAKRFADNIKAAPAPVGTCFSDEIRRRRLPH